MFALIDSFWGLFHWKRLSVDMEDKTGTRLTLEIWVRLWDEKTAFVQFKKRVEELESLGWKEPTFFWL